MIRLPLCSEKWHWQIWQGAFTGCRDQHAHLNFQQLRVVLLCEILQPLHHPAPLLCHLPLNSHSNTYSACDHMQLLSEAR